MINKSVLVFLILCQPLYAADAACDIRAKEGSWESVAVFNGTKRTPVANILLNTALGAKTITLKLDRLPVNASKQEVIDSVGEAPTQDFVKAGYGKMTWIFESAGKAHGASVYFFRNCINEISIQSFPLGKFKEQTMLVKRNQVPDK